MPRIRAASAELPLARILGSSAPALLELHFILLGHFLIFKQ